MAAPPPASCAAAFWHDAISTCASSCARIPIQPAASRAHPQDAAGKENTYMYLGAKKGAAPEVNKLAAAIGQEENPFAFVLEPYFILLFTPFALVMAYEFNHILKFGRF